VFWTPNKTSPILYYVFDMEEPVIYTEFWSVSDIKLLIGMANNRASRGAKFSSITFVDLGGKGNEGEVFKIKLGEHVTRVSR
jgi:hypothetical protein